MATQGLVSITSETGRVEYKIVAGCNGYRAFDLAKKIIATPRHTITAQSLMQMATDVCFGSDDSLVVMDRKEAIGPSLDQSDLGPLYRLTFDCLWFNPRWGYGSADHVYHVNIDTMSIFELFDVRWIEREP